MRYVELVEGKVSDSPAFRAWFGASKVVDAQGNPLVVYHGTSVAFDQFDIEHSPEGLFFTDDPMRAALYAEDEGGRVIPVYLSIQRPAPFQEYAKLAGRGWVRAKQEMERRGYDGVISHDRSYTFVVFRSDQIRSALTEGQARSDNVYYHGTNAAFDMFEPYDGALGRGVYITAYRSIAQDYAKQRQRDKGGAAIVIPVMVDGEILWNGTARHQEAIEEAARLVRHAERHGERLLFNDALRQIVTDLGYVGVGSSENIVIYDPRHLHRRQN